LCKPGFFSQKNAPLCTPCAATTISDIAGAESCFPCDLSRSRTNNNQTACLCDPLYYLPDFKARLASAGADATAIIAVTNSKWTCEVCPDGADCGTQGTTWQTMAALPGWWRDGDESLSFFRCLKADHCIGGRENAEFTGEALGNTRTSSAEITGVQGQLCANNRAGALCASCEDGFLQDLSGACRTCDNSSTVALKISVILITLALLLFQLYIVMRAAREDVDAHVLQRCEALSVEDSAALRAEANISTSRRASAIATSRRSSFPDVVNSVLGSSSSSSASSGGDSSGSGGDSSDSLGSSSSSSDSSDSGSSSDDSSSNSDGTTTDSSAPAEAVPPPPPPPAPPAVSVTVKPDKAPDHDSRNDMMEEFESDDEETKRVEGMIEDLYDDNLDPEQLTLAGPPSPKFDFTTQLKIFLSFLQIVTAVSNGMEVLWPNSYKTILRVLDIVNYNFIINFMVSSCGANSYYHVYLFTVLTPLFVALVVVAVYVFPEYMNWGCYRAMSVRTRTKLKAHCWQALLFVMFWIYPTVSGAVTRLFMCKDIDGTSRLLADVRIDCSTTEWNTYAIPSATLILLYPIGIPLCYWVLLRQNRVEMLEHDLRVRAHYGFLWTAYKTKAWYWEVVDMLHKLFLTCLMPLLPRAFQLPLGMIVTFTYLLVLLRFGPFIRKVDDIFAQIAEVEVFLLLAAGNVFYDMSALDFDAQNDVWTTSALTMITSVVFMFFVGSILYTRRWEKMRAERNAAKKIGEDKKAVAEKLNFKPGAEDLAPEWDKSRENFSAQLGLSESAISKINSRLQSPSKREQSMSKVAEESADDNVVVPSPANSADADAAKSQDNSSADDSAAATSQDGASSF
jgi:hypothetical protein